MQQICNLSAKQLHTGSACADASTQLLMQAKLCSDASQLCNCQRRVDFAMMLHRSGIRPWHGQGAHGCFEYEQAG